MTQLRDFTIGAVAAVVVTAAIVAGFIVFVHDGGDPSLTEMGAASQGTTPADGPSPPPPNSPEPTIDDLRAMTPDDASIASASPLVGERLVRSLLSGPLTRSPLDSDRVKRIGGASGFTSVFSLDGIQEEPPRGHEGLYGLAMEVYLYRNATFASEEYAILASAPRIQGVRGVNTYESERWDEGIYYGGIRGHRDYTEFASVFMLRLGPVIGFVSLASTVEGTLEADATALARLLADTIRERLDLLGASLD